MNADPKSTITHLEPTATLSIAGGISGVLTGLVLYFIRYLSSHGPAFQFVYALIILSPGILFGFAIWIGCSRHIRVSTWRGLLLVVCSTFAYFIAVFCINLRGFFDSQILGAFLGCIGSSTIGAALAGACMVSLLRLHPRRQAICTVIVRGAIVGLVWGAIAATIKRYDDKLLIISAIVLLWHVVVAHGFGKGMKGEKRPVSFKSKRRKKCRAKNARLKFDSLTLECFPAATTYFVALSRETTE